MPRPDQPRSELSQSIQSANGNPLYPELSANVKFEVYDLLGRHVQTLVNAMIPVGHHQVSLDAGWLSSGIYIYRLEAGSERITKKMVLNQ